MQPRDTPMYEAFYGFAQSPFTLAPDPSFLYLGGTHDGALRQLRLAIRRREGFIVLAGDIGTGKTTLCRALIEQLDTSSFTSLVLDPFVTVDELLREVLLDFGVVSRQTARSGRLATASRHDLVATLHDFLLSLQPIGGAAVLIIDEAQHLAPAVLEQIRVLSNLETNKAKLLQVVLVGQLDLLTVLGDQGMRQLDQRISLKARLEPLSRTDVEAYIGHRLDIAGGSSSVVFDASALDTIHAVSAGVPRVINLLCDRALTLGAAAGNRSIGDDTVRTAAAALGLKRAEGDRVTARRLPTWALAVGGLGALAAVAATGAFLLTPAERMVDAPPPASPAPPVTPVRLAPPLPDKPVPETRLPLYPPVPAVSPASP